MTPAKHSFCSVAVLDELLVKSPVRQQHSCFRTSEPGSIPWKNRGRLSQLPQMRGETVPISIELSSSPPHVHCSVGAMPQPTPHRQWLGTESPCVGSQLTSKAHVVLETALRTGMLSNRILGALPRPHSQTFSSAME